MAIDWTNLFKDVGLCARQVNVYLDNVIPTDIVAETVKKVAQLASGEERLETLSDMLAQDKSNAEQIRRFATNVVTIAKSYVIDKVGPVDFDSTYSTLAELLEEMEGLMEDDSETVDANAVGTGGAPVADSDNYGVGVMGTVTPNQMAKNQNFRVECYQIAAGANGAFFRIYGSKDGQLSGAAEEAVSFDTGNAKGGIEFTIASPDYTEANDGSSQLDNWDLTGFSKGVNTAADGKIYVTLTKPGADTLVKLYKDAGKTELVAEGQITAGTSGACTLAEANSSGLSGTVDVAWTIDDTDITLIPPFEYRVDDKFTFSTTSDGAGTFQDFFRDYLGRSMPSNAAGTETVLDAWAE